MTLPTVTLFHGDCIDLAHHVAVSSIDLAYLDPPFTVGTEFRARTKKGETRAHGASAGPVAYTDKYASTQSFVSWLEERVRVIHGLLSPSGALWLHLDQRAIHESKIMLDAVFGRDAFRGEVIWVPGNGAKARKSLPMTHQTLLAYAKGETFTWNYKEDVLREPFAETSQKMHFQRKDADGRHYRERIVGGKAYRYFADKGRALGSVWTDCPAMVCNTPLRKETTGYPTQKPLRLLERIVRACSRVGDRVLDPFAGSGTTLEASFLAGRHSIGCDVGELSLKLCQKRLTEAGANPSVLKIQSNRTLKHRVKKPP